MSTAIRILQLLTAKPLNPWKPGRRTKLSAEQNALLQVLSDEWLENGTPGGQLLAERLVGIITDARCLELGFETWLGICSLHRLVLFLIPEAVLEEIAASGDEVLAFRVVSWLKRERPNSALHGVVAARLWRTLRAVEEAKDAPRERASGYGPLYRLDGLKVLFGNDDSGALVGVTVVSDADGFDILLPNEGPLAAFETYLPPLNRYVMYEPDDEGEW